MKGEPNLELIEKKLAGDQSQLKMLKDLFSKLFEKDPEKRIGMYDIIRDPWVTRDGSSEIELGLSSLTSNDTAFMFGSVGKVEVDSI